MMKTPTRLLRNLSAALLLAAPLLTAGASQAQSGHPDPRTVKGPFGPSWNSLKQYQCSDWFRDAATWQTINLASVTLTLAK